MIYGFDTPEEAEDAADALKFRIGAPALGGHSEPADASRFVTGYRVERYTHRGRPAWGVIERWRYADAPELGVFGGAFIPKDTIRLLMARAPDTEDEE